MASVRGSDIRQLMIGGREFDPAPEGNVTYRLSGFQNESAPTGNGGMHTVQRRKLGGFETLAISVDPTRGDIEYLQDLANAGEPVPCSMAIASATYAGSLTIEGEIDPNTGDGQVEISALGPKFEQV
jgi:hypothetical protein